VETYSDVGVALTAARGGRWRVRDVGDGTAKAATNIPVRSGTHVGPRWPAELGLGWVDVAGIDWAGVSIWRPVWTPGSESIPVRPPRNRNSQNVCGRRHEIPASIRGKNAARGAPYRRHCGECRAEYHGPHVVLVGRDRQTVAPFPAFHQGPGVGIRAIERLLQPSACDWQLTARSGQLA